MTDKKQQGGAREGAGRPPLDNTKKRKSRTLTMDDARWGKFKKLGGSKWLSRMIDSF